MTYIQVSFSSKVGFFSGLKMGHSYHPQTSRPAFLVNFSGILKLKNTILGLIDTQEMCISLFEKWAWPVLTQTKMESSPEAFLGEFRNNTWACITRQKIWGGPLKAMAMKNIITFGYTNSVWSTLLLGGLGACSHRKILKNKCYKIVILLSIL